MKIHSLSLLAAAALTIGAIQIAPAHASEQMLLAQATTVKVNTPRPAAKSKVVVRTPARSTNKVVVRQKAHKTIIRTR